MPALLVPSLRSQERTRPEWSHQMCHLASASDRKNRRWLLGEDGLSEKQQKSEGSQDVHRRVLLGPG